MRCYSLISTLVAALNAGGDLRVYPGSPLVAKALLRPQDRLIACELEPRASAIAQIRPARRSAGRCLAIDGWMAVNANVPPKERRGLVLIDPPYEEGDEFGRLTGALEKAHRKWPSGIYMLWYPIKERGCSGRAGAAADPARRAEGAALRNYTCDHRARMPASLAQV